VHCQALGFIWYCDGTCMLVLWAVNVFHLLCTANGLDAMLSLAMKRRSHHTLQLRLLHAAVVLALAVQLLRLTASCKPVRLLLTWCVGACSAYAIQRMLYLSQGAYPCHAACEPATLIQDARCGASYSSRWEVVQLADPAVPQGSTHPTQCPGAWCLLECRTVANARLSNTAL
jgi:hypothetical protein